MGTSPDLAEAYMADQVRLPIGVLVLARDEEENLPDCLNSVKGWTGQVAVLVDPRTVDGTREVAKRLGAEVYEHPFEGFGVQKNWGIDSIPWRHPWILILDADERVPPELREEFAAVVSSQAPKAAYAMRFRFVFYGRWIKHCWHSTWIIRLFQRGKARYEARDVHEHMVVEGELGHLKNDIFHNDFKDMDAWIAKHNSYATVEASEMLQDEGVGRLRGRLFGSRIERRRFLKERVWNRLPFRPLWLFVYLYFLKLGFLDGALGFRFCVMHAIFDAFTTAKVWEKKRLAMHPPGNYYREGLERFLAEHPVQRRYYD
jgi:glycosyltransferase involved in cell wall biosynthesis